jgi:hypothetical protein
MQSEVKVLKEIREWMFQR